MKAAPVGALAVSMTFALIPSLRQVVKAMAANSSLPSFDMKVTSAPARAAATAWFEPLPPGPILKPEPAIVSPMPGMRPARKARSATKMPRIATPLAIRSPRPDSSGIGRDDALLEDEAAIEAPLAGLDHAIGLLRHLVESHALDRAHRPRTPFGGIDLLLDLGLDRRDLVGLAYHLHAPRRLVDKSIERHHRKDGARGAWRGHTINVQKPPQHGLPGNRIGRKIGVADDEIIAMAHRPQGMEHIGIEQRIDRFQHYGPPPICFFG